MLYIFLYHTLHTTYIGTGKCYSFKLLLQTYLDAIEVGPYEDRPAIWSIFDIVLSTVWPAKSGTVLHTMPPTITCKNYNPIP